MNPVWTPDMFFSTESAQSFLRRNNAVQLSIVEVPNDGDQFKPSRFMLGHKFDGVLIVLKLAGMSS